MISVSDGKAVSVTLAGVEYFLNDDDSYRKLLLSLTDPDPDVSFDEADFDVDPTLSGEKKELAVRYGSFFKDFGEARDKLVKASETDLRNGIEVLSEIVDRLSNEEDRSRSEKELISE